MPLLYPKEYNPDSPPSEKTLPLPIPDEWVPFMINTNNLPNSKDTGNAMKLNQKHHTFPKRKIEMANINFNTQNLTRFSVSIDLSWPHSFSL